MTLLEDPRGDLLVDERAESPSPTTELAPTIDLTTDADPGSQTSTDRQGPETDARPGPAPRVVRVDPSGQMPLRGMRIRRVRLASVAKLALVFHALGFVVVVGTLVVLWNVARALGLVTSLEDMVVTSLGVETFQVNGSALFDLVVLGTAVLAAIGWLVTVLLAAVYNASCAVLGGLAVETGPLRRRRRVFSWRHRGFVTIQA